MRAAAVVQLAALWTLHKVLELQSPETSYWRASSFFEVTRVDLMIDSSPVAFPLQWAALVPDAAHVKPLIWFVQLFTGWLEMSNSQLSILNVRADWGGLGWLAARCSLVAFLRWVASCTWAPDANPCQTPNLIKKANPCQLFARWLETFNFQLSIFSGVEPRTSYRPFVNLAPSLPPSLCTNICIVDSN